MEYQHVFF